jgi:hypothetical protein
MSFSRLIKYLVYAIVLFGFLLITDPILLLARNLIWPYNLTLYITQTVFGALLGLEQLIKQFRQDGHWRINIEKAVFLGLPPIALYAFFLLYYGNFIHISFGSGFLREYGMQIGLLQVYAGIVLGYAITTVFQKSE